MVLFIICFLFHHIEFLIIHRKFENFEIFENFLKSEYLIIF
jgi:hypothetical protein